MSGAFQPTRRSTGPAASRTPRARVSSGGTPKRATSADPTVTTPWALRRDGAQETDVQAVPSENFRKRGGSSAEAISAPAVNPQISPSPARPFLRSVPFPQPHPVAPPTDPAQYSSTPSRHPRPDTPMTPGSANIPATPGAPGPSGSYPPGGFEPQANFPRNTNSTLPATPLANESTFPPFEALPKFVRDFVYFISAQYPANDPSGMWMGKIVEIITHLGRTRPNELESYCRKCFLVYKEKYSLTRRREIRHQQIHQNNIPHNGTHQQDILQPQPLVHLNSNHEAPAVSQQPPLAQPIPNFILQNRAAPTNQAPLPLPIPNVIQESHDAPFSQAQAAAVPSSGPPPNFDPFMPSQSHNHVDRSHPPADPAIPPILQPAVQPFPSHDPPAVPVPNSAAQAFRDHPPSSNHKAQVHNKPARPPAAPESNAPVSHDRILTPAKLDLGGAPAGVPDNSVLKDEDIKQKDMDGLPLNVLMKKAVEDLLIDRRKKFRKALEAMPTMTKDCDAYVIWQPSDPKSGATEIVLPTVKAHLMKGLTDKSSLLPVHLNALRFLWAALVGDKPADIRTGSVFYHGVGYPTRHLLLLFARLYYETFEKYTSKKILVICNPSSVDAWQKNGRNLFPTPVLYVGKLNEQSWYDDVKIWTSKGGVLLCTAEDLKQISLYDPSNDPQRLEALTNLVRPGPDIVVVEEASQICSWDSSTLGVISGIRTSARLAMTSVPFGGNLPTWFPIIDWSCPRLLGTQIDFWHRYLRPVANANTSRMGLEKERESKALVLHLWRRSLHAIHMIGADDRREGLQKLGTRLIEISVVLNFQKEEADVYAFVVKFLKEEIAKKEISRFVVLNVLSALLFSRSAVLNVIDEIGSYRQTLLEDPIYSTSPEDRDSEEQRMKRDLHERYGGMKEAVIRADSCLQKLRAKLENANYPPMSQKLKALIEITTVFMENGDRIVIYVNSDAIRNELHDCLKEAVQDSTPEGGIVYLVDMKNDASIWVKTLNEFNCSKTGAVLLAPYGIWEECMEDFGWSFVNATKVIVLDCCWSSSAVVQAIQRVHNFSPFCLLEVIVMYISVYGTVDSITQDMISRNESTAEQSLPLFNLVDAEITSRNLTYHTDAPRRAENVPSIGWTGIDHPWYRKIVDRLKKLKMSENMFGLNAIHVIKDFYVLLHEILSGTAQRRHTLDLHDRCDLLDDKILPLEKTRLKIAAEEARQSFSQTRNLAKVRTIIQCAEDFHEARNTKRHGLLVPWKKYFSLYEGGGLDKRTVPKAAKAAPDSVNRHSRHPNGSGRGRDSQPGVSPPGNRREGGRPCNDHHARSDPRLNIDSRPGNDPRPHHGRHPEYVRDHDEHPTRHSEGRRGSDPGQRVHANHARDTFGNEERGSKRKRDSFPEGHGRNHDDHLPPNMRRRGEPAPYIEGRVGHRNRSPERNYIHRRNFNPPNGSRDLSDDGMRSPRRSSFAGPAPHNFQAPRRGEEFLQAKENENRPKRLTWENVLPGNQSRGRSNGEKGNRL